MTAVQTANPPTFESVWAALDRLTESQKELNESQKETDRIMRENAKQQKERQEETDRIVEKAGKRLDEVGKRLGDFTNSFGDVAEYMVAPGLQEKFNEFGYDFQEVSTKVKVRDKKNDIKFEIDVFLQNGDTAMLVEIKADLTISWINKHIERLEKMRRYSDLRGDKRHFIGAVAGIVVGDDAKEYALSQGFFLIEPNGEDFNITRPPSKPKEW